MLQPHSENSQTSCSTAPSGFHKFNRRLMPVLVGLSCASASVNMAHAASFALAEQSGAGLGNAYAGGGAVAEDASTVWFNPAGMSYLPEGHSIALGAVVLNRKLTFSDTGSSKVNPLIPLGDNGGNAGGTSTIPSGYYAFRVSPQLAFGLGVSAPYGNRTDWGSNFIGRYQGTYSDIKAININPSVSWKLNDMVSLGFGVSHLKLEADLRSKAPIVVAAPGPTYLGDASIKLKGDDSDWGYNLGAMFQISPTTRVGLTYRSGNKLKLGGSLQVSSAFAATSNQDVSVAIKLPDTWSVSVFQALDGRWEGMGDLTRTGWSSLPALTVLNGSGTTLSNEALNYKNAWRVGLGANYKMSDSLKLRFGVAYDKTPIPDDASRVVRLPDSDRTWLSTGAQWKINKSSALDVGYSHIFFKAGSINRPTVISGNATAQSVIGDFDTRADLLSVQYSASF